LPPEERGSIGRFDRLLGWTYRANGVNRDGTAHTNSLGARGQREYPPSPAPGTTRIAAFGDSFTWCEEVPDDRTWEDLLEREHPSVEALNFGVGGYGTDQAFLRYQELGRGLDADVVAIGLLLENIGRNVNRYRPLWSLTTWMTRAKPRFLLDDGELVLLPQPYESQDELLRHVRDGSVLDDLAEGEHWRGPEVPTGRLSSLVRLFLGWVAYHERQPRTLWLEPEKEPYRVSLEILLRFHRMALADGARLAPVLVYPAREDLEGLLERDDRYWSGLVADLEAHDVPVLDLSAPLFERYRELSAEGRGGSLFSGYHLSGAANQIVADAVWRYLEETRDEGTH
jgi:lysophospholipase L1-like esterase